MGSSQRRAGIVGRRAEIGRLRALLDAAAERGAGLLISGEAGIGKTRLLDAVLHDAGDRFRVVSETASELETDLPFAPLIRAFGLRPGAADPAASQIGDMLARPDVSDPDLLRLQVVEAITDLVERWTLERPVLLAVNDLHWADDATLQSLDRINRRLRHAGGLVAGTARPHPRRGALEALERTFAQIGGASLDLGPLPDDEVIELVRQISGAEPGPRLAAALRGAGGNPLYVEELLAAAADDDDTGTGRVELAVGDIPGSVRRTILRNLSSLPGPTMDMLRMGSVLGTRFDLRQLALVVDRSEPAVVELLAPAFDSGVVAGDGDLVGFRHDLVREAVYQDQPEAVRASSHRHVVERLRTARLPPEDLVPHLLRGSWGSVPEATGWLAEAGRAMRSRQPTVAAELFARALELCDGRVDPDLRLDHAEALAASNRPPQEVAAAIEPLLSISPDALGEPVRDRLVEFAGPHVVTLDMDARQRLLDSLEAAGLSESGRARALAMRAGLLWSAGRLAEAEELARRALGHREADPATSSRLEVVLARLDEGRGRSDAKLIHARRALALAHEAPTQPELVLNASATLAIMLGTDPATRHESEAVVAAAQVLADRTGLDFHQAALEAVAALNAERKGAWQEASTGYEAAISSIVDLDTLPASGAQIYARAARLHVHFDDLELAAERLSAARSVAVRAKRQGEETDEIVILHLAEAEVAQALGDATAARAALDTLVSFVEARGIEVYFATTLPAVMAILSSQDDAQEASDAVARAERWLSASGPPDPHLDGVVRWCRALVGGDDAPFDALLRWADEPRPLWEWKPWIREDAARVFVAHDRHEDAVERLQEALALWDGVGARRDVARVRAALRDLGVHAGRGLAADRPNTGWESLTDAEWRVLDLVGEGLIYREIGERLFISRRTVETHVQHMFNKLDVSSRRDLTRLLHAERAATTSLEGR